VDPHTDGFFDRDALEVAHDLIGCVLTRHEGLRVRITEAEAYRFPGDSANHARMGLTPRNAPMWGPSGHLYVYLCYGVHPMLNLVTGPGGHAAAVLLRGGEPMQDTIMGRGGAPRLDGPGKLARALGVTTAHTGLRLDAVFALDAPDRPVTRLAGPRVGIDYAAPEHRDAPWRVACASSLHVGHRRTLAPIPATSSAPGSR
jgi:DNA-3-methyladenine glycosylase